MTGQEITVGMRDRILAEATRRFVIHGYNSISMREIAEACGIKKAALYYHFKGKEDLFLAILSRYLDEMDGLIRRCRAQGAGGRPRGSARIRLEPDGSGQSGLGRSTR